MPVTDMKIGADTPIEWKANKDRAVALLDGGNAGEIVMITIDMTSKDVK